MINEIAMTLLKKEAHEMTFLWSVGCVCMLFVFVCEVMWSIDGKINDFN